MIRRLLGRTEISFLIPSEMEDYFADKKKKDFVRMICPECIHNIRRITGRHCDDLFSYETRFDVGEQPKLAVQCNRYERNYKVEKCKQMRSD